jgi:hypothetical protein
MAIRLLRMSDGGASLASLLAWVFVSFSRGIYWRFVFFFFSESCVLFALALERGVGAFSSFHSWSYFYEFDILSGVCRVFLRVGFFWFVCISVLVHSTLAFWTEWITSCPAFSEHWIEHECKLDAAIPISLTPDGLFVRVSG